jgi:hypothetical protein
VGTRLVLATVSVEQASLDPVRDFHWKPSSATVTNADLLLVLKVSLKSFFYVLANWVSVG